MRFAIIAAATLSIAAPAAAEPTIKCAFEGKTTTVTIVNDAAKSQTCSYFCNFRTDAADATVEGEATLRAGETRTVKTDTQPSAVKGVMSSSLGCH